MDLDNLLNPEQRAAVEYCDGSSVIVAGAGSGKTRVLTYKVAYLLQHGMSPDSILALTFTNKAAREMRDRIMRVVDYRDARRLMMGTFHSVFSRILRIEANNIGLTPQYTIYDSADSKNVVKTIIKEMALDDKKYKPAAIHQKISMAKNHMVTPSAYAQSSENYYRDNTNGVPQFAEIFQRYCARCREANAMDFDDILVYTATLFRQHPDVLQRYAGRFQYILVDEYQDTNTVQHAIVLQLASVHKRVCVVGDDAQSIYSFRGAEIDNILGFQRVFDNCRLFKLQRNYRSTQTIVEAANTLIAKNRSQIPKKVFSENALGGAIDVLCAYSDYDEAAQVAQRISSSVRRHDVQYSDIAILYRTNSQSRVLEDEFRKNAIPYRIYGGQSFYQRKEIKDVIAYMRLLVNPHDEEALKRIINVPARGLGDTTQKKLFELAHARPDVPVLTIAARPLEYGLDVNKGTAAKLERFAGMMQQLADANEYSDAYTITERLLFETRLMADAAADTSIEGMSRKENIDEFLGAVHDFCDRKVNEGDENTEINIVNFLNEVALATDQDTQDDSDPNVVTLMTIHAAKGLEFDHVYIVGVEENLFPSMMIESERELEEERRLFYVAITRAKEVCTISYAKSRFRNGQTQYSNPSRFLYDIDRRYLNLPAEMKRGSRRVDPYASSMWDDDTHSTFDSRRPSSYGERGDERQLPFKGGASSGCQHSELQTSTAGRKLSRVSTATSQSSSSTAVTAALAPGDSVYHDSFGHGTVERLEGTGHNAKAVIDFDIHGTKTLLLRFARLTKE